MRRVGGMPGLAVDHHPGHNVDNAITGKLRSAEGSVETRVDRSKVLPQLSFRPLGATRLSWRDQDE